MTTTTTVVHTTIDFSPLINQVVLPLLSAGLLTLASWIAAYIVRFFKLKISAQQGAVVDAALANGINLAVHQLGVKIDQHSTVDVKNQAVAIAAEYAMPKIAAEAKALGITPESIDQRIQARLPTTPPIPPTPSEGTA